jgi:hypothetical protein
VLLALLVTTAPLQAGAYETDQFSNRLEPIADSTELLNQRVDATIRDIAEDWKGPRSEQRFVNRVFHHIGGHHWVDRLERWAMNNPEVERLSTPRRKSIYSGHPIWATRVTTFFGIGPTIKINNVLVGSDKIGHFLSQGRKYYRRYQRSGDEAQAGEWSAFTERAIFGQVTTGSYSNADLVANYEGYVFYRSLFEDNVIPGKPAILQWEDGGWVVQRAFDWADHVNEYWDEALNINHYDRLLYDHMQQRLMDFCNDYQRRPARYRIDDEAELAQRYAHLGLRKTSELRLSNLCPGAPSSEKAVTASRPEP